MGMPRHCLWQQRYIEASRAPETFYHGYITKVGTRGNGGVFIEFASALGLPQCSQSQVEIPVSNPAAKMILAVAMAAYIANLRVYIQTDGCAGVFPTMSGEGSWLYPTP
jgi:hypothetical protein